MKEYKTGSSTATKTLSVSYPRIEPSSPGRTRHLCRSWPSLSVSYPRIEPSSPAGPLALSSTSLALSVSYPRIEPSSKCGRDVVEGHGQPFQYPTLGSNHLHLLVTSRKGPLVSLSVSYPRIEPSSRPKYYPGIILPKAFSILPSDRTIFTG